MNRVFLNKKTKILIRPTTLIVFGNPEHYSLTVTCKQTLALDLPQKILIWQNSIGQAWIGYELPPETRDNSGINCKKFEQQMASSIREIASKASGRFGNYVE